MVKRNCTILDCRDEGLKIIAPINERGLVLGGGNYFQDVLIGDDIPSHIRGMQALIEGFCSSFVATIGSNGNSVTNYDGADEIEMWSWDKMKERVLGHDWTRTNLDGACNKLISYGPYQNGDYIDCKLWEEMKLVLNELWWTQGNTAWTTNHEAFFKESRCDKLSWTDAKAGVESIYAASTPTSGPWAPVKVTYGQTTDNNNSYAALIINSYSYIFAHSLAAGIAKTVDFYVKSEAWLGADMVYNNNGMSYLQQDKWGKHPVSMTLSSGDASSGLCLVGDNSFGIPVWCDEPVWPTSYSISRGCSMSYKTCIVKWDFVPIR